MILLPPLLQNFPNLPISPGIKAKGLLLSFLDFPHPFPSWPGLPFSAPMSHAPGPLALHGPWPCHFCYTALTLALPSGQKALQMDSHQLSHLLQISLASALDLPVLHLCSVSPHSTCPWNDRITFYLVFLSPLPHLTMAPHKQRCLSCFVHSRVISTHKNARHIIKINCL